MASKGLREKAERAKSELRETGRSLGRSRVVVGCAQWFIRFLLAATLATGEVFAGAAPFGLAFVGASGAGNQGFAAMIGAVCGYLLSRGLEDGLRYAAGCVLVFSTAFAFLDLGVYKKSWFMPVVAGGFNAVTGLVTLTPRPWTSTAVVTFAGEVLLTAVGVYAFRSAFSLWRGEGEDAQPGFRQRVGVIFLGLVLLLSLGRLTLLGGLSVGRICAALAALCAGSAAGPGAGAAVGLAGGLAMDLNVAAGRFYAVSYALGGLCAGLLRSRSRFWRALSFSACVGMVLVWGAQGTLGLAALYEADAAALIFLFLPQRLLNQAEVLFAAENRPGKSQWAYRSALRQLKDAAGAFGEVFASLRTAFDGPGDNGEDPSVIYDRAANRVCCRCAMRERCWQSEYQDTYDMLNNALPAILAETQARAEHFPQRFRDRCVRFSAFLAAVNEELSALLLRRRYKSQVGRSRKAVCDQYGDMARLLEDAAAAMAAPLTADAPRTRKLGRFLAGRELNCQGLVFFDQAGHLQLQLDGPDAQALTDETARAALSSLLDVPLAPASLSGDQVLYRQREPLTALAGVAGRKKEGQSVSGDACGWFKDDRGRLYILLCDGMGSGREARRESDLCLRLLEKFLRAGVEPQGALKTLDQALCLREEEAGGFSTVDLLELDLYSGKGCVYKLGAAPSYLRRQGGVKCLSGRSLPAGLTGGAAPAPDRFSFQVDPGDCLVLLTDGVLDGEDQWLKDALMDFDGGSPAALAETLVTHGDGALDDKTALVLRIGLRAEEPEDNGKAAV